MNVAQMLMTPVAPLFSPEEKDARVDNAENRRRRGEARARMASVLPEGEWVAGSELARRLGANPSSLHKTLAGFRSRDELECRIIKGTHRSLEWRWK
jgi:hypothetical protein